MEEGDGKIELIPRTHIISGSLVMSPDGLFYYVSPFDGNRVDFVTLYPLFNKDFHDLGGPFAILALHIPKEVDYQTLLEEYLVIVNEEGTAYPN
ncbi:MAG TPA: hypothetical protein PKU78_00450 [Candidatus Dojkabacteria bacterium]|nr:hypothetical protein [Candidatus Dojkabacteria bacterium]HRO64675.1 hypothetical protein [Candidatus Dojkabacteria bacterium]HRP36543.1 hypothetical protein [Candidatus Dojkabacteria bacterium]HRP51021.1 hypothetical protein [Candidatus Dojkabacteria bacterium]